MFKIRDNVIASYPKGLVLGGKVQMVIVVNGQEPSYSVAFLCGGHHIFPESSIKLDIYKIST